MTPKRIVLGLIAALALAVLLGLLAHWLAAVTLRGQLLAALGPQSEVDAVVLRAGSVVVEGLRIRAPAGWPAPLALSARRVVVVPELRTLLSAHPRIARIELEDVYLSVLRTGDGGLRVLPGVLDRVPQPGAGPGETGRARPGESGRARSGESGRAEPGESGRAGATAMAPAGSTGSPGSSGSPRGPVSIGRIDLRGGSLDYFDGSVRREPHRVRIDQLDATLTDLQFPALAARSMLRLAGTVRAAPREPAARDGTLAVDGWIAIAPRDSQLAARLRGIDLVALQPYLARAADTAVRAGTLELDLNVSVANGRLKAPGVLTLTGLELASGGGRFLGLPRDAALALLKDRQGGIRIDFVLQGSLDDPQFSISEALTVRAAAALAESMGISLEGLVRGVGGIGRKGAESAVDTIRGLLGR